MRTLDSKFFRDHTLDIELFGRYQNLMTWSRHLIPLYEWQNILYIGVGNITPPSTASNQSAYMTEHGPLQICYLKCSPNDLERIWSKYLDKTTLDLTKSNTPSARSSTNILDIADKASHQKVEKLVEDLFHHALEHYNKVMILKVIQNEIFYFKWSESFNPSIKALDTISLKEASMFRIVAKSQKPFFGSPSVNEIHNVFFEVWNNGVYPENVTIAPMVLFENVIGLVLTIGSQQSTNRTILNTLANETQKFIEEISEIPAAKDHDEPAA